MAGHRISLWRESISEADMRLPMFKLLLAALLTTSPILDGLVIPFVKSKNGDTVVLIIFATPLMEYEEAPKCGMLPAADEDVEDEAAESRDAAEVDEDDADGISEDS